MPLNNQLAPECRDWSGIVFSGLPPASGVLFEEVTLDERIGPEAVALLIDPKPAELLAKVSVQLNLKADIAATAYGPVLFLIWWIPPVVNGRPLALYEPVMNPLYSKTSVVLRRVADQTHLHVLVVDVAGQVLNLFEHPNTFGFDIHRGDLAHAITYPCCQYRSSNIDPGDRFVSPSLEKVAPQLSGKISAWIHGTTLHKDNERPEEVSKRSNQTSRLCTAPFTAVSTRD
jgi:hypothetical protein